MALGPPQLAADPATGADSTRRFGDYELLKQIGQGGMGVVYKARQVSLNRIVAVKMILAGQLANAEDVRRFRAEATSAAALQHPNIIPIYETGESDGHHYFTMEFVDGDDLSGRVREHPLPARDAARYVRIAAGAVQYAHECGILHRDLKPSNILVDSFDQPRIADFGLAKRMGEDGELTLTGQVLGAPSFVSPEQAAGRRAQVGPRSDVYALGAILYHLLTGRPPFAADTLSATLAQVENNEPAAPRVLNPAIPRDLETICLKCLEKDPRRRFHSARELAEELDRFERGEPILARPVGRPERIWRWCRRHRAVSSLAAFVVILHVVIAWLSLYLNHRTGEEARKQAGLRQAADIAKVDAQAQRRKAEESLVEVTNKNAQLEARTSELQRTLSELQRQKQQTENALTDANKQRASALEHAAAAEQARAAAATNLVLAENNRALAEQRAAEARVQQARVEDVMAFLLFDLTGKLRSLGRVDVLQEVNDRVLAHYQSLPEDDASETAALRRAHAFKNAGLVLALHGRSDRAMQAYQKSLDIVQRGIGWKTNAVLWEPELGSLHLRLGELSAAHGDFPAALQRFQSCLEIVRGRVATGGGAPWNALALAAQLNRGDCLRAQAQRVDALEAFVEAVNTASNLVRLDPASVAWQRELSFSHGKVSALLLDEWGIDNALPPARASWEIAGRLTTNAPADTGLQLDFATSCDRLGDVLTAKGAAREARVHYRQAREIRARLVETDSGNTAWQRDHLQSQFRHAGLLAAESRESRILEVFRRGAAAVWDFPARHFELAGQMFAPEQRTTHALAACREAVERARILAVKDWRNSQWQEDLAKAHTAHGDLLLQENENAAALEEYRAALEIRVRLASSITNASYAVYSLALSRAKLGVALHRLKDRDRALAEVRASLGIFHTLASQWPGNFVLLEGPRDPDRNLSRLSLGPAQQDELGEVFGPAYRRAAIAYYTRRHDRPAGENLAGLCSEMAVARFLMGDFAKAADQAAEALRLRNEQPITDSTNIAPHQLARAEVALAAYQILRGDGPAAVATARHALEREPDSAALKAMLVLGCVLAGRTDEARGILIANRHLAVDGKRTFPEAVLADLHRLAGRGIPRAEVEKIEHALRTAQ
jgi:tetratricopeptide (TPR) repeat protein/tRNA A-37 threonylcarbamoyl transferase component Bud32